MSLFNLEDVQQTHMPHKQSYNHWMGNLSEEHFNVIIAAIHELMDATPIGKQVITSSWIPGSDWTDTPYDPIYQACHQDWDAARFFFGQLVWRSVQLHPEKWYFIRQQRDDDRPIGMTYFQSNS
ncbi:MAG: hypothetical protein P9X24_18015 [Candidatus Hatepunaea meridiana]|nr:hypothetical protein [Candidatus Hatepunaea meridiana]